MITSISHVTFIVSDVKKMGEFLRTIFDAEEIYDSADKNYSLSYEKFFIIGGTWIAVMEGKSLTERSYNHIAFKIPESEFDKHVSKINQLGVDIKSDRNRVGAEERSIYFYDYDNHLFELHTGTIEDRLLHYKK
jgi:catechol 2,3-dioxygenase-like lactoylglutathione lyase family enzyme